MEKRQKYKHFENAVLPWQRNFLTRFFYVLNPHYSGNYTGEFRDRILKTHDTMGHNAQTYALTKSVQGATLIRI